MKKFISTLLVVAILCTMIPFQVVIAADSDILYNTQRTEFVISEANGANAKMFMLKDGDEHKAGADFTDFVKGLDYTGYLAYDEARKGVYPTGTDSDKMATNAPIGALVYTIDGKDNNDAYNNYANFVTKNGKIYWNIDGTDYLINPQDKAIKLYTQVKTDDVADAELAERFNTLNEVTLEVEDGNYYEVGFLAATGYKRTLNVTLVYTDGSTEKQSVVVPTALSNVGQSTGSVYFQQVNTHAIAALVRKFKPYTVLADTSKTLDKVKLSSNYYQNPILIISAWGEKPSVKNMLDKITNADELTEENYLAAQSEIEKVMAYIEVCGLTYNDLDEDMKAKVDAINNPFGYILANMIAKLDVNEEITGANIYEIKDALAKIEEYKNDINTYITKKSKIAGDLSKAGSYIKGLIQEREEYQSKLKSMSEYVNAPMSGVVSYRVDGLEEELTPESFDKLNNKYLEGLNLKTGQIVATSKQMGKVINNYECYIATIMDSKEAKEATENHLTSEDYEKIEKLTNFIYESFDITFGNRILNQIENLVPVFVACGGTKEDALDFLLSRKVLAKVEGRFEEYVKDALKQFLTLLNKTYGKGVFKRCEATVNSLMRRL